MGSQPASKTAVKKETKMKYLLVIPLIIFIGCEDVSTHSHSIGMHSVKEVRLSDGTQCAVYDGVYGGGISCNWK